MDKYFIDKQNEIILKIKEKSTEELIQFLDMDIENPRIAASVINQFKTTLTH